MIAYPTLRIHSDRLWSRLMSMAEIGATPAGGVHRLALDDADRRARDLFTESCEELGLAVTVDAIGNMFARRPGTDTDALPVAIGSHLDSQPTGGKFDGPLGVLAALEVVETLNDNDIETSHPIEVVNWTNEEGARFAPAMMGSGVFSGRFELDDMLAVRDPDGVSVGEAIDAIGYRGDAPAGGCRFAAALELHIEQGPRLEEAGTDIAVVTGVQGTRWFDLTITGEETHAGPTPMSHRVDPVAVMGEALQRVYTAVENDFAPEGRVTFGVIEAHPASRNTVPGSVVLTVDIRHPDDEQLDGIEARLCHEVAAACDVRRATWSLDDVWRSPAIEFAPECRDAVRRAAENCGYSSTEMMSGAGHDSVHVADIAPTGMIFVPCEGGVSHNEAENITPEQAAAGANVLLHAVLELAGGSTP